jgi:hypothetical protein
MNVQELREMLNRLPSEWDSVEVSADVGVEFNPNGTNLWLYAYTPIRKGSSGYEQNGELILSFNE